MNLLVCEFATKRENRRATDSETVEALYFFPRSLAGLNLGSVVKLAWAASHDRMRREAVAAAHEGDLTGKAGISTRLINIVTEWRNRASQRGAGSAMGL